MKQSLRVAAHDKGTYQDVRFVGKRVVSLLGDEKQLVEEEECPLILGPLDAEGAFQYEFSVAGQVRAFPVSEQTLDLLEMGWQRRED